MERTWYRIKTVAKKNNGFIKTAAYAGLKVHPDRASWCIADGEMVHRHR